MRAWVRAVEPPARARVALFALAACVSIPASTFWHRVGERPVHWGVLTLAAIVGLARALPKSWQPLAWIPLVAFSAAQFAWRGITLFATPWSHATAAAPVALSAVVAWRVARAGERGSQVAARAAFLLAITPIASRLARLGNDDPLAGWSMAGLIIVSTASLAAMVFDDDGWATVTRLSTRVPGKSYAKTGALSSSVLAVAIPTLLVAVWDARSLLQDRANLQRAALQCLAVEHANAIEGNEANKNGGRWTLNFRDKSPETEWTFELHKFDGSQGVRRLIASRTDSDTIQTLAWEREEDVMQKLKDGCEAGRTRAAESASVKTKPQTASELFDALPRATPAPQISVPVLALTAALTPAAIIAMLILTGLLVLLRDAARCLSRTEDAGADEAWWAVDVRGRFASAVSALVALPVAYAGAAFAWVLITIADGFVRVIRGTGWELGTSYWVAAPVAIAASSLGLDACIAMHRTWALRRTVPSPEAAPDPGPT